MGKKKKQKAAKKAKKQEAALARLSENVTGRAREIWLAGLGALDRARKDGAGQFDALVTQGGKVRDAGSDVIDDVLDQIENAGRLASTSAKKAGGAVGEVAGSVVGSVEGTLETAVEAVLAKAGIPRREEVEALTRQLQALQAKLDAVGVKSSAAVYSLVPHDKGWAIERAGAQQASSVHGTKKEALVAGRKLAKQHAPSRLVIHKADGSEQETVTYDD